LDERIPMKKQQSVDPYLVGANESRRLARVSNIDKKLNEQWVQKLLFENPSLLPAIEIESAFSPVISIARELPTKAGSIDLLFISPYGYIILVETKLFRNPEARREVVAQTLDYAKELSQWSYDDLIKACRRKHS
jgi:RecB family endonuclease NucS